MERVPPAAPADVWIFAAPAVAIPLRHGNVPAIWRGEKNFLGRWKQFRCSEFVSRLGVRSPTQFAIEGNGRAHFDHGSGRSEFHHTRQARSTCRDRLR